MYRTPFYTDSVQHLIRISDELGVTHAKAVDRLRILIQVTAVHHYLIILPHRDETVSSATRYRVHDILLSDDTLLHEDIPQILIVLGKSQHTTHRRQCLLQPLTEEHTLCGSPSCGFHDDVRST